MQPIRIRPGQRGRARMPYSEVMCHMQQAGQVWDFEVLDKQYPSVQLLRSDGTHYSGSVTLGEAGVYQDSEGLYYYADWRGDATQDHVEQCIVLLVDTIRSL